MANNKARNGGRSLYIIGTIVLTVAALAAGASIALTLRAITESADTYKCTIDENTEYYGNDLPGKAAIPSQGQNDCMLKCASEIDCMYWTYRQKDGHCWLKTSNKGKRENKDDLSGSRNCMELATVEDMDALKQEIKILKEASPCPSPWTLLSTGCYLWTTKPRTWRQARQFCNNTEAKLLEVTSEEEHTAILGEMEKRDFNTKKLDPWLGLTDLETEGEFKWESTNALITFNKWKEGEPSGGEEHCVHYFTNNLWNDLVCAWNSSSHGSTVAVCEKF